YFFICMAVAIFIPLFLTLFFKKSGILTKTEEEKLVSDAVIASTTETKSAKEKAVVSGTKISVVSPLSGLAKPLDQASDPVFSQGIMGKGVVIDPSDGELVSPVDATVSVLFPTKHAIGLLTSEGVEFLIHIGMDTVNLEGKGFTSHVAQGDNVKVGDKLITFDIPMIKEEGYIVETPILITNQEEFRPEELIDLPKQIKRGQALMVAKKI
ncbi:TPA: PTS glucose transporter subunit IIA, partial [Streptococcus agalactiae]